MASDVDLVLLTSNPDRHCHGLDWATSFDRRARLVREQTWGPLRERRVRLSSGLVVELGVVTPSWVAAPLDAGTEKVLRDGWQILYDPEGIIRATIERL
jgi:hypothetical protein